MAGPQTRTQWLSRADLWVRRNGGDGRQRLWAPHRRAPALSDCRHPLGEAIALIRRPRKSVFRQSSSKQQWRGRDVVFAKHRQRRSGQTMHVSDNASLPSKSFSAIRRHTRPPGRYPRHLAAARRCDRPDAKVRAQAPLQFGIVNTPNLTREYFFSASLQTIGSPHTRAGSGTDPTASFSTCSYDRRSR